jgi:gamma-glutamyltranspeptidase/glutathione hydrolase
MAKIDEFAGVKLARSPVYGTNGMVVSGHSLASLSGLRVLEKGGSLVDAMISTSAVLCTVLPHATSFGGDAFIIYHDAKSGETMGLNASGPSPADTTPDLFPDGMIADGPLAASVPGIVRGWERLHQRFGRLDWADLFADAIDLAGNGHPLSRVLAGALVLFNERVSRDPGCSEIYLPGGVALKAGDLVKQPALAETIRKIATNGSDTYYEGSIAQSIGAYSQANGGTLSAADFAGYEPEWVDVLRCDYRGHDVCVMPPNSYGLLMLMQLNAIKALEPEAMTGPDSERLAYLMTAARVAFDEGRHYICDPAIHPAPTDELLGGQMTGRLQATVADAAPGAHQPPGVGGTSCITMMDKHGNALSVVQSVFHVFGSAFLDPGTGILLNNRMTGFVTEPGHRNVVAPRKRPGHTLNPVMIFRDGKIRYLLTTPGGPAQTISNVQMLTNMVDRGMELSAAIAEPRWSIDGQGNALIDDEFPDSVEAELTARGFEVARASGASYFGSSKCIEVLDNGVMAGAADHRREAYAAGW